MLLRLSVGSWVLLLAFLLTVSFQSFGQDDDEINLKPLLNKWLLNEKLPAGVISLTTFKKATKFDGSEENIDISFLNLDGHGQKELAVQSGCAAVGNCELVIYSKVGKSYRRLLTTEMVQTIRPLSTMTRGYRDLELRTHGSAYESYHRVFKFDGSRYKRNRCWSESYVYLDKKNNQHILKKPIITRGCGSEY
jgi:hypothetical protein